MPKSYSKNFIFENDFIKNMGCLKLHTAYKTDLQISWINKAVRSNKTKNNYRSAYLYGFNGKELDKEASATTTYDYGFRIYNPGLGKFLSVDPLTKKYPELTPYQFASNRPIDGIDLDGLEFLKAGTAAFILQAKKYRDDAFSTGEQIYKAPSDLILRNKAAYQISAKHIEAAEKYAEGFPGSEAEEAKKDYKRGDVGFRRADYTANRVGKAGDFIGQIEGLYIMSKVLFNMYNEKYDPKTKELITIANNTWAGIAAANTLVKLSAANPTFPAKLNTKEVLTDLTNFITDGTLPDNKGTNHNYSTIISTWGTLIFNNQQTVANGTMNFAPLQKQIISKTGLNGMQFSFTVITGNSNPDVIEANDKIKNIEVKSQPIVQQSN